jgi:molybdopterin molybdotransferase
MLKLPLATDFRRRRAERYQFVPCKVTTGGSLLPVEFHGSAHLLALNGIHGFLTIPEGITELKAETFVEFFPLYMAP